MRRQRSIKTNLPASGSLASVSIGARYLFVTLLLSADDEGRLPGTLAMIRRQSFPYDDIDNETLVQWLQELCSIEAIRVYGHPGTTKMYVELPNFNKHQSVPRAQPSDLPRPSARNPIVDYRSLQNAMISNGLPKTRSLPADSCLVKLSEAKSSEGITVPSSLRSEETSIPLLSLTANEPEPTTDLVLAEPAPLPGLGQPTLNENVHDVFDRWLAVTGRTRQTHKLTKERRKHIVARLREGYEPEQLEKVMRYYAKNPHYNGENDRGKVYDDIPNYLRNETRVQSALEDIAHQQRKPGRPGDAPRQSTADLQAKIAAVRAGTYRPTEGLGA